MDTEIKPLQSGARPGGKALLFLIGIMFLNGLGFCVIGPVVPFIVKDYISNPDDLGAVIGWLTAVYAICQIVVAPALGLLSDRYGRRPVLLFCLLGSAIGYVMFGLGGGLAILFASRIIDGLTGGNFSVAFAYVADTTAPEERPKVFGKVGAVTGVSFIIGPVIGGLAAKISLSAPLYLAAGLTVLALIWGYFFLPESLHHSTKRDQLALRELNPFAQLGAVVRLKNLQPLLALGMLYAFPFAVLTTNFGVLIIDSLHWDATSIGLVSLSIGVMDVVVQGWLFGKLLPRFGASKLITAGLVLQAVAYGLIGLIALVPSTLLLLAGTTVYAFSSGLVEPALAGLTSQAVGPDQQGLVGGASQSLQSLMRVLGPLWVGYIYTQFGHATPYWLNIVFVALGILMMLVTASKFPGKATVNVKEPALDRS
ncbi:MAG TPA: MFS transporter [Chloroflexia bacterium]|nr:MFS transporter [Chloroflexia bacterium]